MNAAWAVGEDKNGSIYGPSEDSPTVVDRIGTRTTEELLAFLKKDLEEHYVAHWDNGGIDWDNGGFVPEWNNAGEEDYHRKSMYDMGRGLWVFSYLYNHFGKRDRHRRAAKLCTEFILAHCRDKTTGWWLSEVSIDGSQLEGPYDIYGDMYAILGLTEYWKISGDDALLDIAVDTAHGITERIVAPDYRHYKAHKERIEPGTKILGTWQHFLSALTPLARVKRDNGIEMMARMCVRNILERHWRPEYGVYMEYLDDRFEPFRPGYDRELRKVSSWHSIQSAWICMDEALRTGDRHMFAEALETGRMTFEKCWLKNDDGTDAGLVGLDYPEQPVAQSSDSPAWGRLDDAMVFAMLAIEHTHAPWAVQWFDRIFTLGYSKAESFNRNGLLHHPRRLFFCINSLENMIARGGNVSDFMTSYFLSTDDADNRRKIYMKPRKTQKDMKK